MAKKPARYQPERRVQPVEYLKCVIITPESPQGMRLAGRLKRDYPEVAFHIVHPLFFDPLSEFDMVYGDAKCHRSRNIAYHLFQHHIPAVFWDWRGKTNYGPFHNAVKRAKLNRDANSW